MWRRPGVAATAVLTGALAVLLLLVGAGRGGEGQASALSDDLGVALSSLARTQPRPAVRGTAQAPASGGPFSGPVAKRGGRPHLIATVLPGSQVVLRRSPGGPPVAALGDRTEFGSERNFWIVRRRGSWLGVASERAPGGLGWIRADRSRLRVGRSPWWIDADLSRRRVRLWRGERIVHRFAVSVGAPDSPTPPGRYAVTDGLTTRGEYADYYGCCVLALTGRQPNLPQGWVGGDRIAIHGTPGSAGGAASAGCLRASDSDMAVLFRRVPLGTPVLISR